MSAARIAGIVLVVAGVLALARDGFSFTKESHKADIGPLSVSVDEKRTVEIPTWVGIVCIAAGVALIGVPRAKRG
jgi:hypothetical protein